MSVLSAVLEKLKMENRRKFRTAWQEYWAGHVAKLADEQQVDVDSLGICLDTLDKSHSDLEVDIALLRRRRQFAATKLKHEGEAKRLPKLQADFAAANQALQDAIAKLQPKVDEAAQAVKHCVLAMDQTSGAEADLIRTCQDPEILSEESLLQAERQPLVAELRDLQSLGSRAPNHVLKHTVGRVAELRRGLPAEGDTTYSYPRETAEILNLERAIVRHTAEAQQYSDRLADLSQKIAELDRKQVALNARKLVP